MAEAHIGFVISDYFLDVFSTINNATLCTVVCTFGMATNIINIIVFIKSGFSDTVNISLLALVVSDFFSLLAFQWMNISLNPLFINSDISWVIADVVYITGGCSHATFARITSWITAFISFERCLCVVMPLKIKQIITAPVTKIVNISIYFLMGLSHFPEYITLYLGWRYFKEANRTLIAIIPRENRSQVDLLSYLIAVLSQLTSFVAVIAFTIILIFQMKKKSKWRRSMTSGGVGMPGNHQQRNDRTVKTVLVVAVAYIVCFFPSIVVYICSIIVPEVSITGRYKNAFRVAWYAAFMFEAINCSSNFCVFYIMSSKFRVTCQQMNPFKIRNRKLKS